MAGGQRKSRKDVDEATTGSEDVVWKAIKWPAEQRREGIELGWTGRAWVGRAGESEFKRPASRVRVELATTSP
jgi:hypothetical protein